MEFAKVLVSPDKTTCAKEASKQHHPPPPAPTPPRSSKSSNQRSLSPTRSLRTRNSYHNLEGGAPLNSCHTSHPSHPLFQQPLLNHFTPPSLSQTFDQPFAEGRRMSEAIHLQRSQSAQQNAATLSVAFQGSSIDDFDVQHITLKGQEKTHGSSRSELMLRRGVDPAKLLRIQICNANAAAVLQETFESSPFQDSSAFFKKNETEQVAGWKPIRWADLDDEDEEEQDDITQTAAVSIPSKWGDLEEDDEEVEEVEGGVRRWGDFEDDDDDEDSEDQGRSATAQSYQPMRWGDAEDDDDEWGQPFDIDEEANLDLSPVDNEALKVVGNCNCASPVSTILSSPCPEHSDIRVFLTNASSPPKTAPYEVMRGSSVKEVKFRVKGKAGAGYLALNSKRLVFGDQENDQEGDVVDDMIETQFRTDLLPVSPMTSSPRQKFPNSKEKNKDSAAPLPPMHLLMKMSDMDFFNIQVFPNNINPNSTNGSTCTDLVRSVRRPPLPRFPKAIAMSPAAEELGEEEDPDKRMCLFLSDGNAPPPIDNLEDVMAGAVVHLVVERSTLISAAYLKDGMVEVTLTSGLDRTVNAMKPNVGINSVFQGKMCPPLPSASSPPEETFMPNLEVERPPNSLMERTRSMKNMLYVEEEVISAHPDRTSSHQVMSKSFLQAKEGLRQGQAPDLAPSGTGGTYFLRDAVGAKVAVFKPEDEEPQAINNPRGFGPQGNGEGLRKGTRAGEGALREVASYLLDHQHFSGVPATCLAQLSGDHVQKEGEEFMPKRGALQQFVPCISDCEEMGTNGFHFEEVHKIAILDMRLGNTDRNGGNILVRKRPEDEPQDRGLYELVPIDHGYTLPHSLHDLSFDWQFWPQADVPFSEASLKYIASLDAESDLKTLAAAGLDLPVECEQNFRIFTMILQKGAAAGLTPSAIASIMTRTMLNQMSHLEKMHALATKSAKKSGTRDTNSIGRPVLIRSFTEEESFIHDIGVLMDQYIEGLTTSY